MAVENLYFVRPGDTLWSIGRRAGTTVEELVAANILCDPDRIFPGEVLVIPRPWLVLPPAGAWPYYVVRPGDTLWCLSRRTGVPLAVLAAVNQLVDPSLILTGEELLLATTVPDATELRRQWEETAAQYCDVMSSLQVYGVYYLGSFAWAALGAAAVPHLVDLLANPCVTVRIYAAVALGRIALDGRAGGALRAALRDPEVAHWAELALRRIKLAGEGKKRVHLVTTDSALAPEPVLGAPGTPLPAGTAVEVLRWHIPSPIGEELPPGGLAIWDYVRVVETGETGFLLRVGYAQIVVI